MKVTHGGHVFSVQEEAGAKDQLVVRNIRPPRQLARRHWAVVAQVWLGVLMLFDTAQGGVTKFN